MRESFRIRTTNGRRKHPTKRCFSLRRKATIDNRMSGWTLNFVLREETLCCAWDEKTFGIAAFGDKDKKTQADVGAFSGRMLPSGRISRLPPRSGLISASSPKSLTRTEEHGRRGSRLVELQKQSKATASKKSSNAKKVTSRFPEVGEGNTFDEGWGDQNYVPRYLLSKSTEQDRNNFGWFTVEQLKQWPRTKGPSMSEEQRRGRKKPLKSCPGSIDAWVHRGLTCL